MCSAEGLSIPPALPPIWLSSLDSSDPSRGIHCQRITQEQAVKLGIQGVRLLIRILALDPFVP